MRKPYNPTGEELASVYSLAAEFVASETAAYACWAILRASRELFGQSFRRSNRVGDIAKAHFVAAFKPKSASIYNPWMGEPTSEHNRSRRVLALLTMEQIALGNAMQPDAID